MSAFYNEFDAFASQWLRNLEAKDLIARGTIDDRSVKDLTAADLDGFRQCHFFAGIGVWSYALRLAGWADDLEVWTGSCPCQPFSAAGKRGGKADERHLWPDWFKLIDKRRPAAIFGEQVASPDGLAWLDDVSADLERAGYAVGAADLCAAGVGAPHIRQRLYFAAFKPDAVIRLADDDDDRFGEQRRSELPEDGNTSHGHDADGCGAARGVGDDDDERSQRRERDRDGADQRTSRPPSLASLAQRVGYPGGARSGGDTGTVSRSEAESDREGSFTRRVTHESVPAGATGDFWGNADWLACADGRWRPVEPGTFPLVNGTPNRVGRCRGYGNAIVSKVAATFVRAAVGAWNSRA